MTWITIKFTLAAIAFIYPSCALPGFMPRASSNGPKAGLAWPNGNSDNIAQYETTGKISWYYTWSAYPVNTDLEFVPMLWGSNSIDQFSSTINQTISQQHVKYVLSMNEPDQPGQSSLTPQQGVSIWQEYIQPLHSKGVMLGSPATSSAPAGKTWVQQFLAACNGCSVDFIALHWYGTNATQFIEYVQDFRNTFQKPIWVTEWACENYVNANAQCSQEDVVLFLNATQSFLDSTDYVQRYSWFGAMENLQGVNPDNALMSSSGQINNLGKQYIGASSPSTSGSGSPNGPSSSSSGAISDGLLNSIYLRYFMIILFIPVLLF